MPFLYATTNPGKIAEVRNVVQPHGIDLLAPSDLGLALDVTEPGDTLEANAAGKTRAYLAALSDREDRDSYVVLGDDTGVEIDALNGEPGIHVRRWDGSARMTDEAVIVYCLERLRGVPPENRGAQFRTVFAIGVSGGDIEYFDGTLRGVILEEPDPLRIDGFPFESIFFVPEWNRLLGHALQLPAEEQAHFVTHRARALQNALPRLRELLDR
jgi:XTP/dITP diphosphohydrolase